MPAQHEVPPSIGGTVPTDHEQSVVELAAHALAGAGLQWLAREAANLVARALQADLVEVLELQPDGSRMLHRAGVGWDDTPAEEPTVSCGPGSQGHYVLRAVAPVFIEDLRAETRFLPAPSLLSHGAVSGVAVPVRAGDQPCGILAAYTRGPRGYAPEHISRLQAVARVLGAAVLHDRGEQVLSRQLRDAQDREERLTAMARGLLAAGVLPGPAASEEVLRTAVSVTGVSNASFFRYDEAEDTLVLVARAEPEPEPLEAGQRTVLFPRGQERGLVGLVAASGQPFYVPDTGVEPRWVSPRPEIRSCYFVPVSFGGRFHGVMRLVSTTPNGISQAQRSLADTMAAYVGAALESARLLDEARLRSEELETLFEAAQALGQKASLEEKATRMVEKIAGVAQAALVALRVVDEDRKTHYLLARAGSSASRVLVPQVLPMDQGIAAVALDQDGPVVSNNYLADPRALPDLVEEGIRSALALAVRVNEKPVALLFVNSLEPDHFTEARVRMLAAVAEGLGALIVNARLEEAQRLHAEELETLFGMTRLLVAPGTFEEKARRVVDELTRISQAGTVALRVPDERQTALRLVAASGSLASAPRSRPLLPVVEGLSGLAFRTGAPVVSNDYSTDPRASRPFLAQGMRSVLAVPIQSGGRMVGVITVSSTSPGHFTPRSTRLITAVADGIGALIDNARLYDELRVELEHSKRLGADVEDRNRTLEQRVRELGSLNELFQQHLAQRFAVVQAYQELTGGLQQILQQGNALTEMARGRSGSAARPSQPAA